jgi:hypothetical protein
LKEGIAKKRKTAASWSEEKIERLRQLASEGLSSKTIGQQIGCSQSNVSHRAKRHEIKLHCTNSTGGMKRGRPLRHPFIDGEVGKIPLTKGLFAIIDIADIPLVSGRNWFASKRTEGSIYVATARYAGNPQIHLHRFLTGTPIEFCVDHKDGDPLNNRRGNLRVCTYAENCFNKRMNRRNTSGQTGVTRRRNKWSAFIHVRDQTIRLGIFVQFEDAVKARKLAEIKYFGEFARAS